MIPQTSIHLADAFSVLKPGDLLTFSAIVAVVVLIGVGILTFINQFRLAFGRKPPLDEDLKVYSATVAKLQTDLAKLPDDKKFEELVKRLDTFATVTQVAALAETFHRETKNVDVYAHSEVHRINNEVNALQLGAIDRGERLAAVESRLESHDNWLRDINTKLDKVVDRVSDKVQELIMKWRNGE